MADLNKDQKDYLQGLRNGNVKASQLAIRDQITSESLNDFANFDRFIKKYGHHNPEPADLYLSVSRLAFLRMLFYAADRSRDCLVLQNCFGFDTPPVRKDINEGKEPPLQPFFELTQVGRLVLIQKGNFQQRPGQTDEELYIGDSVYRNAQGDFELFLNMDIDRPLAVDDARQYIDNFLNTYPKARQAEEKNPIIHGFLLPVRPLINLFTSSSDALGRADMLTFRWGIISFTDGSPLGNFSLVIGAGDLTSGRVIEFRTEALAGTGMNDCPPHTGCRV